MSNLFLGALAGLPLCVLGTIYVFARFDALAKIFRDSDPGMSTMTDGALRLMLLAMFGLSPLLLGGVAGLVHGALGSRLFFPGLTLVLAALMSVWAIVSRTPLMVDKIVMNFAVAATLGLLIPRLAGA